MDIDYELTPEHINEEIRAARRTRKLTEGREFQANNKREQCTTILAS